MRGSGYACALVLVGCGGTTTVGSVTVTATATKDALDIIEHVGVPTDVTFRDMTVRIDSNVVGSGAAHFDLTQELQEGEVIAIVGHPAGRSAVSIDAPSPAPLALTLSPTSLMHGDLSVTWTPSGSADDMDWTMGGCSLFSADGPIRDDTGTLTIPAEVLPTIRSPMPACQIQLTVTRARTLSPEGEDLVIIAQTRDAGFTVTP
jgi:hypothetical protein